MTAAEGRRPEWRHLMSQNFSKPRSLPKPLSVTTRSPSFTPTWSARTEELPWAMLPKGPVWTKTGPCSSVCSRFGLCAARRRAGKGAPGLGAAGLEHPGRPRRPLLRLGDDDPAQTLPQVGEAGRQADDRHHLRGDGDVERRLPRDAVVLAAEADDYVPQGPVVDVDDARPGDGKRVDLQLVAVQEVVVGHRREQVVGHGDSVRVAGEVEVEVLHRHHLGVAAAGGAALDAEGRAEAGLADGGDRPLADAVERLREADRRGGLGLRRGGRGYRRYVNYLARWLVLQALEDVERYLRLVLTVELDLVRQQAELLGDRIDGGGGCLLRDLEVALHQVLRRTSAAIHGGTGTRRGRRWGHRTRGPHCRHCDAATINARGGLGTLPMYPRAACSRLAAWRRPPARAPTCPR